MPTRGRKTASPKQPIRRASQANSLLLRAFPIPIHILQYTTFTRVVPGKDKSTSFSGSPTHGAVRPTLPVRAWRPNLQIVRPHRTVCPAGNRLITNERRRVNEESSVSYTDLTPTCRSHPDSFLLASRLNPRTVGANP
ncbi:unnamed protein product [Chondrus crispus]|uniref:Uncharacterized protein n=1 Tax=Chondrus crispus TaxID=2769 RepID=R7QUS2_CHOCR|nr:unnamed protein product [Chondrus crispus]CDF41090.1 unnamed protein product [Chondrus crispus]|eukprot:XP_005711384.1 unnamed protein product [Chondrus crispus]